MSIRNQHLRDNSVESSGNSSEGGTWATVTSKNAHRPLKNLVRSNTEPAESGIKRNKKGQRLDEPMEYDRDEVQRIKKMKSCNQHYIGMYLSHKFKTSVLPRPALPLP